MATTQRNRPRIGDRAWQVDWCAGVPITECGDADIDNADYRREIFGTREAAYRRAREIAKLDAFEPLSVMPVEFVPYDEDDAPRYPHVGYWESTGIPDYYEDGFRNRSNEQT